MNQRAPWIDDLTVLFAGIGIVVYAACVLHRFFG
jgi:hypothetical protein